ncbi:MAG: hypothetical protein DRR11_11110, partial [Gammaproteobacteria bacterium]
MTLTLSGCQYHDFLFAYAGAMTSGVLALLSILPIAFVAVFLVGLRWPASRAMPLAYIVCA